MLKKTWKKYGKVIAAAVFLTAAGFCYGFARSGDGDVSLDEVMAYEETSRGENAYESGYTAEGMSADISNAGIVGSTGPQATADQEVGRVAEVQGIGGQMGNQVSGWYVHICGEVENPGVYELPEGSRIFEAVEAAGGLTAEAADQSLNLADKITDGMQIVVLSRAEAAAAAESQGAEGRGLVNINKASREQLMTLSGIGESRADDIIRYREESGGFKTIEDIMKVPGIKDAAFLKIKDSITV